ncbi:outer membrane protein, multidrug efflux system [Pseudomonas citronellolis]|uniref:Outer membrane protein, multidrug efflux system n=1 Tax=Pseudomonas citronellolis TaxID=53408 RepID=A0AAQ1KKE1_9PSED|nr:AdeC/AdeK/OprM family multidrug efflux complex outer membrane factor [Pseudomonas citronellolis]MCP1607664.1 multidrug efflux system outer membrane protein [Pseudomonas citronellolis]MCP1658572.1 multidrug efflux system outer membrane protein [Pseudomonas citronellolis]MCP1725488.1 multidrug efflux system outer membrane protein [Pseudomonas citronellolis]MDN6875343.1 AdeC/AdeK/OprM family multidrug efflux complex outer membrane factor [Pseudomonas citronellolis]TGC28427.1 AdeC/AdeK/OprM fam
MRKSLLSLALATAALSGCSLIPDYQRPEAPVAQAYPQGPAYAGAQGGGATAAADLDWQRFFSDPQLRRLVEVALDNNRDLRVAALNVEAYQAQYRIQRAELFPAVSADVSGSRQRLPERVSTTGNDMISSQYGATLGVTAWEVDLFGRLRSLRDEALEQYLATEEARRSTQTALVANVANAYLTLRADQAQLQLTRDTLATYQKTYDLTKRSNEVGVASALDLRQAQTSVESARATLAQYTRLVAQDQNALTLLLGSGVPADLPQGMDLEQQVLAQVPAGLPSDLLQRRPDVLEAEHQLKAANANIGAARAAFFPSISLTANAGSLSPDLSGLFDAGSGTWLFKPSISLPIFNAGSLKASLDLAKVQKNIYVAQYEKAIQTAFSEVADGLAARGTYGEQLTAQRALVKASEDYYRLAEKRYRTGVDNYLTLLDAQRSLFSAQQQLITDRLNQLTSEVNLYKALGGGWQESTAQKQSQPQPKG